MRFITSQLGRARRRGQAVALILTVVVAGGGLAAPASAGAPTPAATPSATGQLASTVHVLATLKPTIVVQFPLVPSGLKKAFPDATGLVTLVGDSINAGLSDSVTVDVHHLPPNITFTIFLTEIAAAPFGNVEYVADLTTRGDGSGEAVFNAITIFAFAMDARAPGTSKDQEGTTSGVNLDHLGMWFSSLTDAQTVLGDQTLKGTEFDAGTPPLHAGPQAMTDGQTAPVF